MSRLNLSASTPMEEVILQYLEENASDVLAEKINSGKKTLANCLAFITAEAKKMAVGGSAMVEDKVVYGWAVHFFEEDSIRAEQPKTAAKITAKTEPEKKEVPTPKKEAKKQVIKSEAEQFEGQMNIFNFLED